MARVMSLLWPLALYLLAVLVQAQDANGSLTIYDDSDKYKYYGCYNETTQIEGSSQNRALVGGINEVKEGEMTVPMCLNFCANGRTQYRYAGLEWSRECWCSQELAGIAKKLDNEACNLPCEGNKTMACGGSLKLTVYRISAASGLIAPGFLTLSGVVLAFLL